VFILEQGPYLDPDGLDQRSWHLLGRLGHDWNGLPAGELVLYLRAVDPGLKYDEPALGRVVNHPPCAAWAWAVCWWARACAAAT
jgi:ElaA protein